jgi:hypothetical protein
MNRRDQIDWESLILAIAFAAAAFFCLAPILK